ncbi:PspC domain-containing protein [Aquipuribacter hungaricus]|uniref:PspC domain-containing protein n=2 Tax=Aquipuribacter hungaricus TaxID=545624 RepID=A0ABV7WJC9_9MICO
MTESTGTPPADATTPPPAPGPPPGGPTPSGPTPSGPTPGGPTSRGADQLWDVLRRSGVRRPLDDRWLGGVCSGVARRLGIDPVLLRVLLAASLLLGGVGLVAYGLALVLLPDHDGRIELERASRGDLTGTAVGAVALVVLAVVTPSPWGLFAGGDLVSGGDVVGAIVVGTLLLVGLALLPQLRGLVDKATGPSPQPGQTWAGQSAWASETDWTSWTGGGTTTTAATADGNPGSGSTAWAAPATTYGRSSYGAPPAPRPPRPVRAGRKGPGPALSAAATGAAVVAAGAAWLVADAGLVEGRPAVLAACAALVVLGLVLVGLGVAGRRDGGVGFTTFLVLLAVVAALLVPSWRTSQVAGERTWAPDDVREARLGGSVGLGDGYLDLSGLEDLPSGAAVEVPVRVGIGELTVLVPEGMDVRVDAGAVVGGTRVGEDGTGDGESDGGLALDRRLLDADDPQVVVDAFVGIGTVVVLEVEQ